jgi:hypothetical protein
VYELENLGKANVQLEELEQFILYVLSNNRFLDKRFMDLHMDASFKLMHCAALLNTVLGSDSTQHYKNYF